MVSVLPSHSVADLRSLQEVDPLLKEVLVFWHRQSPPTSVERQQLPKSALALLRQWGRLVEKDGVLFRKVFRSDGGEEFLQLILPAALKQETLSQPHHEHGHQGIERTTEVSPATLLLARNVFGHKAVGLGVPALPSRQRLWTWVTQLHGPPACLTT